MTIDEYFGLFIQFLLSFDYVKSLARVSKYHFNYCCNVNVITPVMQRIIVREFGAKMYEKQTKHQQEKVYASIRWLYGLLRDTESLTNDPFFNDKWNGLGSYEFNTTYYLMNNAPKSLFPIKYGFKHYLKQYSSISNMVWNLGDGEQENIFEWMLKLLFRDDAPVSLISDFFQFVVQNYSNDKDDYFLANDGANMYLMLKGMLHNLIKCQPQHVLWWFNKICYPRTNQHMWSSGDNATVQLLTVMVNGFHEKICTECYVQPKTKPIFDVGKWEPEKWKQLLCTHNMRGKMKILGDIVDIKHNTETRKGWVFLRKPCYAYRQIVQQIFDVNYFENFEIERLDTMEIPNNLRQYKFLYQQCNVLTYELRKRIILFMTSQYSRLDVDTEDVVLNELQNNDGIIIQSVFRMFFRENKWRRVTVKKRMYTCIQDASSDDEVLFNKDYMDANDVTLGFDNFD
eukprot:231700_1